MHRALCFAALAASLLLLAAAAGCDRSPGQPGPGGVDAIRAEAASLAPGGVPVKALAPLGEVWRVLADEYVEPGALDPQRLSRGAVEAMLQATGDPAARDLGPFPRSGRPLPSGLPVELRPVWDAWSALFSRQNTPERPLDPVALYQAAIGGLLEALGDPHTEYIAPDRYELEAPDFAGNYQGVGAEILRRGESFIMRPMPGGPAEAAGLRAGDLLVAVDGQPVAGWTLAEAVRRIRGPEGTLVTLLVLHLGEEEPVSLEIARGVIQLRSVTGDLAADSIAYVQLTAFYGSSAVDLDGHLRRALVEGAQGIVLDLRNNSGGLLSTSIEVASLFLREGLVVYEVDGSGKRTDHPVVQGGIAQDVPLVVLVNEFSASGSEVVAGAIQDHGRAVLVGARTFGKGSVNRLRRLSDGGGLYYSFARWYTPGGRLIEGQGLEPEVAVPGSIGVQGDPQLDRALAEVRLAMASRAAWRPGRHGQPLARSR